MWERELRVFFFFQAEDGIRDWSVTGVQTCALPICIIITISYRADDTVNAGENTAKDAEQNTGRVVNQEIGRASCRERV